MGLFPTPQARITSVVDVNSTSHTVSLPAGIAAGDLLIVEFSCDGSAIVTFPAGFTKFFDADSSFNVLAAAFRQADGTEGATITVISSISEKSAHAAYRITGHEDPATQPPEVSVAAFGSDALPDPGSLAPTGGTKDYLWIACHGHDGDKTVTAFPANYLNGISAQGSTATSVGIGSAERELNTASDNPGPFTISAQDDWVACVIAIHPAAGKGKAISPGEITHIDRIS